MYKFINRNLVGFHKVFENRISYIFGDFYPMIFDSIFNRLSKRNSTQKVNTLRLSKKDASNELVK